MVPRTDGRPFPHQAQANAERCVGCGVCVGACPSSSPFRSAQDLVAGIDLPDLALSLLRNRVIETAAEAAQGTGRCLTLACEDGAGRPGVVVMPCVGTAPPR
jgi:ferredoxin